MQNQRKTYLVCWLAFGASLLIVVANVNLAAQGNTGTILGTVADSSGGAIPEARARVTNTGTGAIQSVTSDSQGRYRVSDLPVGEYQVETEKMGFQAVVHQRITLDVGAKIVVDFSLPVGQVTQTVTVEGNVSEVETTSSAISNTVDQGQMRDLPLNGRNFEELILLSPGVNIETNPAASKTSFTGFSNYWSVSGLAPTVRGNSLTAQTFKTIRTGGRARASGNYAGSRWHR